MDKHFVATVEDFGPGTHRLVDVGPRKVGVFNVDGDYHALPNVCVHQWGPVCEGMVSGTVVARPENNFELEWTKEGRILVCPWHSAEFDIETGQCLYNKRLKLRKYDVTVEDGRVYVTA
jgi:nitrite reductase/ring-hydroxylating ferredoxin subunit